MVACRGPFAVLGAELSVALRPVPWRKLATGVGIGLGSLAALLFVVLAAAEMTDDLRPSRGGRRAALSAAALSAAAAAPPPGVVDTGVSPSGASKQDEPGPASTIEIDDEAPHVTTSRVAPAGSSRKVLHSKRKKGPDVFRR